jgi:hypothetical protein
VSSFTGSEKQLLAANQIFVAKTVLPVDKRPQELALGCFGAAVAAEAVARTSATESAIFELVTMLCLRCADRF